MRAVTIFIVLAILAICSTAQSVNEANWTTISSKNGDFSVALPADFLVYDNADRNETTLLSSFGDSSYKISMIESTNGKERLNFTRKQDKLHEGSQAENYKMGRFEIATYTIEKNVYSLSIYIASSSAFYSISILAKSRDNKAVGAFLKSILLNGKPIIKQSNAPAPIAGKSISAKTLKTSQLIDEALQLKQTQKIEIQHDGLIDKVNLDIFYSRQLVLLRKERPTYTESARQDSVQGTVELQILFKGDGNIGKISVVRGLRSGLTNEAIRVAKNIKFLPAEIDGKPVDVTTYVEYGFSIY
jgi:TonB family protein